jgi:glucose-1-phosphate adenylyltransferase
MLAGGQGTRLKQLTSGGPSRRCPSGASSASSTSRCRTASTRRAPHRRADPVQGALADPHLQRGWSFLRGEFGEFIELLPAQQRIETSWYAGTADAVYQNIDIIRRMWPEYVLILAGDHVYKMDYGQMIAHHVESGADITVGCLEVPGARHAPSA